MSLGVTAIAICHTCRSWCQPLFISLVGSDVAGNTLLAHWHQLGLTTKGIKVLQGIATPSVIAIFNLGTHTNHDLNLTAAAA